MERVFSCCCFTSKVQP